MEHETSQNLEGKGVLTLFGEIEPKCSETLRRKIFSYFIEKGKGPTIIIDSVGGNINCALEIYDCIKAIKAPVKAFVIGQCSSAALIVLAACTERACSKNANFLFHAATYRFSLKSTFTNHEEVMRKWLQRTTEKDERRMAALCESFRMEEAKLSELEFEGEEFGKRMFADEAKSLGIIHQISETIPEFA